MRKCMEELRYLLKAKIKCIWIDTYEEYEVIKDLKEIVADMTGFKLYAWSHTSGLQQVSLSKKEKQDPPDKTVNVEKIFSKIGEAQDDKETKNDNIWIIKDLHLINDTHQVKRIIRDIKERPSKNYNPMIIIAPMVSIPIEHEKLFTILHYDTPERKEIETIVSILGSKMKDANAATNQPIYKTPTADDIRKIVNACIGLTYNEIVDVLAKSNAKYKELSLKAIMEQKIQMVEKSGVLDYKLPIAKFEDVGGNYVFKAWVEEEEASMSDNAVAFGCSRPKGYLALGVPGTAKSYLAECISNKWGVPLLQLNMSKIMNKLVGESEKRIDQAFRIAKACAPCVLLIDEVEKALSGTRSSNASDAGTTSRVFSTVLQFLNEDTGVFVIMTSNDVSQLPPELTRCGRLDAMWYFSLPTLEERKDIFKIHLGKTGKEITQELIDAAAAATPNYTGAEIKEIVKVAMRKAYKRFGIDGNNCIIEQDIIAAAHETVPIYESSREKIAFLEEWVHGRARYTNGRIDNEGFDSYKDNALLEDTLRLEE